MWSKQASNTPEYSQHVWASESLFLEAPKLFINHHLHGRSGSKGDWKKLGEGGRHVFGSNSPIRIFNSRAKPWTIWPFHSGMKETRPRPRALRCAPGFEPGAGTSTVRPHHWHVRVCVLAHGRRQGQLWREMGNSPAVLMGGLLVPLCCRSEPRRPQQLLPFRTEMSTELLLFPSGNKCHGPGPAKPSWSPAASAPSDEKGALF